MPVDDLNTTPLSAQSSNASGLSPNAREFVPQESGSGLNVLVQDGNSSVPKRKQQHSGAVPKQSTFYGDDNNRRRNNNKNQAPRFQKNGYNAETSSGRKETRDQNSAVDSKKFFKDNQNYNYQNRDSRNETRDSRNENRDSRNENRASRNDGYFSRNNNVRNGNFWPQQQQQPSARNRMDRYSERPEDRNYERYDRYDYDERRDENPKRNSTRDNHQPTRKKPSQQQQQQNKFKKEKSIEPSKISQREQLIKDIENNTLECMICCDKIRDHQPTWSCSNCYHILHLNCLRTWITNSKSESGEWRCVACQFLRSETPRDYICFCGKQKYPAVNRNDLAHSCGDQCGRTDNCQHPCTLRCHPGPHIICQSFVERSCGCGKSSKTFQCSMKETFECDAICEKILNCGIHKCQQRCHQGECESCLEPTEMTCFCGKDSKKEICSTENALITKYSCDKTCDLPLDCNNHRCIFVCHPQKCGSCSLAPEIVKSCPCGRKKIESDQRKSCIDPIPLCKSQCSKALRCGPLASPHGCTKNCHLGECPPCSKTTNVKCRCGRIEEKIACKDLASTDVRCKKKCNKFRTCGKHRCNQSCCIELEHVCTQQCGRMLECKKHKCQRPCHIGNCTPCHRVSFDELRCECGTSVVYPPVPCGTVVPECSNKCIRRHSCSHPVNHLCHSEPNCPPCVFLTSKFCYGKHEQRKTIPCCQDSFSCGMGCGKMLKCVRHKCLKKCHQNECEKATDVCKQLCTIKRSTCEHNCNAPCHDGSCPERQCKVPMEVSCICGNIKENMSCEQVAHENQKLQRVKLALRMQMQDGETVEMKDICGDGSKQTVKILACNNDCATLERNRRLDIAFKVENPNLASYPKFIPSYTEFVRGFYKKDSAFVNMVHEKLTELVKLAKESKQKSRSHSFAVMNRDKRHVVHDLGAMFGVETQAYDAEPNRNIVATASRESCWLPSMSLAEVIQKETGMRRPPTMSTKK